MQKLSLVLLLCSLLISISGSHAETQFPNGDEFEYANLCLGKQKVTKLRFYIHDVISGDHPTVWPVARSNITDILPSNFGLVAVVDNRVTSEPEIDSEIGRAQGLIEFADLNETAVSFSLNLAFTNGKYSGSSISISGRNPLSHPVREVSIVAGTGVFRMARGYAITRTYYSDSITRNGIFQYDAVIYHVNDNAM